MVICWSCAADKELHACPRGRVTSVTVATIVFSTTTGGAGLFGGGDFFVGGGDLTGGACTRVNFHIILGVFFGAWTRLMLCPQDEDEETLAGAMPSMYLQLDSWSGMIS
jgi:hypothetical protein